MTERGRSEPRIVYADAHFLVVEKPSGLPTTAPDRGPCLRAWAEASSGRTLHATSRLDAEVTGLVTFAATKRGNAHVLEARRRGQYGRGYVALTSGAPLPDQGRWDAPIALHPRDRRLRAAVADNARAPGLKRASTSFLVRARCGEGAVLWLTPHTGRTHQLRVHAAAAGAPLWGDVHYGGPRRIVLADGRVVRAARVMLHCAWVRLPGLEGASDLAFSSTPPADLSRCWEAVGGDTDALRPDPPLAASPLGR